MIAIARTSAPVTLSAPSLRRRSSIARGWKKNTHAPIAVADTDVRENGAGLGMAIPAMYTGHGRDARATIFINKAYDPQLDY